MHRSKKLCLIAVTAACVIGVAEPGAAATTDSVASGDVAYLAGDNSDAQVLGNGAVGLNSPSPVRVGPQHWISVTADTYSTIAVRSDGTLWGWGAINGSHRPERIGPANTWTKVSGGVDHVVALRSNGGLWAWGSNGAGQLGDGTTTAHPAPERIGAASNWASVAAYAGYTLGIRTDGTLWGWGTVTNSTMPTRIGTARNWTSVSANVRAYGARADGTLWTLSSSGPVQVGTDTNWASASGTADHTLAVRTDGTLWAWGDNRYGQLGIGGRHQRPTNPVQVGSATDWASASAGSLYSLGVRTDGTLWAWGRNNFGQLGLGTMQQLRTTPAQVGTATTWASTVAQEFTSFGLRADGTLWAWGRGGNGNLGIEPIPQTVPTLTPSQGRWSELATSGIWAAGIRSNGTLWTWGNPSSGELGDGNYRSNLGSVAEQQITAARDWTSVTAGGAFGLGLRRNGTLWGWGDDLSGELGDDCHCYWHTRPVQIGTDTNWARVAAGGAHTVAVRTDGTLWAWGVNNQGQLGDRTTLTRYTPVQIGTATDWASVAAGLSHSAAIRTDGSLWAWGDNAEGQLGSGTTTNSTRPVRIGIATDWAAVAVGANHTVALRTDGTLWAWGDNSLGQLGDGTTTNRTSPEQIGTATDWASVEAGELQTVALRTDGTLWAWGYNAVGQLGDGTTTDQHAPEQIGTATNWVSLGQLGASSYVTAVLAAPEESN